MDQPRPKIRLFVTADLSNGGGVTLSKDQSHYAVRVMRQGVGDACVVFNGRDGEWLARIVEAGKSACQLSLETQLRPQTRESDLWLVFAPIKKSRLDFLVEKATELGVTRLLPVMTRHTDVSRVNIERLRASVIEAAEQCERLSVPEVCEAVALEKLITAWPVDHTLFVLDETGRGTPVSKAFAAHAAAGGEAALLVGPEGGFSASELDDLRELPFVSAVVLGPRVLRAETAALSALACWQSIAGDGCEVRLR